MLSNLARTDTGGPGRRAAGIEGQNNEHLESLMTPELSEAARKCPLVKALLTLDTTPDEIILMLAKLKNQLLQDVANLKLLAPKRIRMADGRLLIWRCPEELIPVQERSLQDVDDSLWNLPYIDPTEDSSG
jgi:hypothetical protein